MFYSYGAAVASYNKLIGEIIWITTQKMMLYIGQHCGYWWPAPGHQQPQWWPIYNIILWVLMHIISPVCLLVGHMFRLEIRHHSVQWCPLTEGPLCRKRAIKLHWLIAHSLTHSDCGYATQRASNAERSPLGFYCHDVFFTTWYLDWPILLICLWKACHWRHETCHGFPYHILWYCQHIL